MYYEEDDRFDDIYEGYIHEDDLPDFEHIKDHLDGMIRAMYQTGNVDELERSLEEVLSAFDMHLPKEEPVLIKKKQDFSAKLFNLGLACSHSQRALIAAGQ